MAREDGTHPVPSHQHPLSYFMIRDIIPMASNPPSGNSKGRLTSIVRTIPPLQSTSDQFSSYLPSKLFCYSQSTEKE